MKLFVVLAVVAFTGSRASVLRSDEPKPRLELVKDRFWEYFVKATKSAHDSLQTFGQSEFGQEVSAKIEESEAVASQFAKTVLDQVSIIGQEYHEKVSEQIKRLKKYLQQDINEASAQLKPYVEEMRANIKPLVQKLRQLVDPYTGSRDIKGLEYALHQRINEVGDIVGTCVEKLLSQLVSQLVSQLKPSTEELQEKVVQRIKEIERSVDRLSDTFGNVIHFPIRVIYLFDIMEGLREKVRPYVREVKSELTALWESKSV